MRKLLCIAVVALMSMPFVPAEAAARIKYVAKSVRIASGGAGETTATCPPGTQVSGGGASLESQKMVLTQSNVSGTGTGWTGTALNPTGRSRKLKVFAACAITARLPAGTTFTAGTNPSSVGANGTGDITLSCPSPDLVSGGRFEIATTDPNLAVIADRPADGLDAGSVADDGWQLRFTNPEDQPVVFDTTIVCMHGGAGLFIEGHSTFKHILAHSGGSVGVKCSHGQVTGGGGYFFATGSLRTTRPTGLRASPPGNGWQVKGLTSASPDDLFSWALCLRT